MLQSMLHMHGVYFVQFDPQLKLNLINIFKQGYLQRHGAVMQVSIMCELRLWTQDVRANQSILW